MQTTRLYSEKVSSRGLLYILGAVTLLLFSALLWQLFLGPLGSRPAPNGILVAMVVFFALITYNFRTLTIELDETGLRVSYGWLSSFRPWTSITDVELDEKNHFYGYGVRFGRYKGAWFWIYNIMGGQRVVFHTGAGQKRGLIISTQEPDRLLSISKARVNPS